MSKGNGPKPEIKMPCPVERLEQIATIAPRLEVLLTEISKRRLSPRCYGLFKRLAYTVPVFRLALNLKTVIGQLCTRDVSNILTDGLTEDEHDALVEVDSSSMPLEARRTAHSLLDIDARIKLRDTLTGVFRDMQTRKSHVLTDKPLDN